MERTKATHAAHAARIRMPGHHDTDHLTNTGTQAGSSEIANLVDSVAAVERMSVAQLQHRYVEVFRERTASRNRAYLRKRIAYRLQELAEGGLSSRARKRIAELLPLAPLRYRGSSSTSSPPTETEPPLPPPSTTRRITPGTVLRRMHRGTSHQVVALDKGFLYRGHQFRSLSAIARTITGTEWNGWAFFGLRNVGRRKK